MAKENQKSHQSPAVDLPAGIPIPEGYVEQQTGLPPYWAPSEVALAEGKPQFFHGKVVYYDDGTENDTFERWVIQAISPQECKRGKKEDAETVHVKTGEFFSISDYAGLPLGRYIGFPVFVYAKPKRSIDKGRTVWEWGLRTTPEVAKLVAERIEKMVAAQHAQSKLPGKGDTKALPAAGQSSAADELPI